MNEIIPGEVIVENFDKLNINESKEGVSKGKVDNKDNKDKIDKDDKNETNVSSDNFDKTFNELLNMVFVEKRNVYVSGSGGCGKTYMIKKLYEECVKRGISTGLTSTTGVSAHGLGLGARTLHSWAAIKLGKEPVNVIVDKIKNNKDTKTRIISAVILIIDEISMCSAETIQLIDKVLTEVRIGRREIQKLQRANMPVPAFGGLQIVASGDMLQLEPVNGTFLFQSPIWQTLNFKYIRMYIPYRYPDLKFFELLTRAREGELTPEDIKLLRTRVQAYDDYKRLERMGKVGSIKPTRIYSLKKDVETINLAELDKLEGDTNVYEATDFIIPKNPKDKQYIDKAGYSNYMDTIVAREIMLKPGAQVMLTINMDVESGLVNGSRGVVESCEDDQIKVTFKCGKTIDMIPHPYEYEDDTVTCVRHQFPLILAYSITIHKCQGMTIDSAIIDLGTSLFCSALGYVALSRCRTLDGIYIVNLMPEKIVPNPEALEFDRQLVKSINSK